MKAKEIIFALCFCLLLVSLHVKANDVQISDKLYAKISFNPPIEPSRVFEILNVNADVVYVEGILNVGGVEVKDFYFIDKDLIVFCPCSNT